MRHNLLVLLVSLLVPYQQYAQTVEDQAVAQSWPLQVKIESAQDFSIAVSADRQVQAAQVGMALPGFLYFRGTIDNERHWNFSCRKEAEGRESIPCTLIPVGEYKGRWIHDSNIIQVVGGSTDATIMRFLKVDTEVKNPPGADDPVLQAPVFDFPVRVPSGQSLASYPYLIHVYGSASLYLPAGQLPARSTCNAYTWSAYETTVNCMASPPREINRGYVTVDFSAGKTFYASMKCWAKWRWSHCSSLDSGFYYARSDKKRIIVLTHDSKGTPHEVSFEAQLPNSTSARSPIK